MKIRNGFVSNSSTSSFICDFCGYLVAERDLCLSDAGMIYCEHEHLFCEDHAENFNLWDLTDENFKDIKEMLLRRIEKYSDDNCEWEKDFIEKIDLYLESDDEEKDADMEDYLDSIEATYYLREEIGIPEKYCPVCKRLKEMQQDTDYEIYKQLFEKFNGILPNGTGSEINQ